LAGRRFARHLALVLSRKSLGSPRTAVWSAVTLGALCVASIAGAQPPSVQPPSVQPPSAQAPTSIGASDQPVHVEGIRFVVGDRPFHVVGANVGVMHGPAHRSAMSATLEAAAADGLTVVRVWALGEYPSDAPSWSRDYAFRVGPDGWIEASFAHLDRVLAEARRLSLRVVIVLANRWGDYGGATQYLRWSGEGGQERTTPPLGLTAFWESAECERLYRAHVRRVIQRTNTVTGVRYVDDPTIFAWELMNEAEGAGALGEEAMLEWLARQAAFVRSLDGTHLVSAGHIGYSRIGDRALWRRVCELEGIDYCDSHAYPLRHGRVRRAAALARWIDDRVQLAHYVIGKPLLFGEIGVRTDRPRVRGAARATWIARFFERVLSDGAAGALLWTYVPSAGDRRTYGVYTEGARARQTRDVRAALRRLARIAQRRVPRATNRAIGPERGDAPIFDPTVRLVGPAPLHRAWRDEGDTSSLFIDPRDFERARFEGTGVYDGGPGPPHFYGAGSGEVSYRVRLPSRAPSALLLRLRASSELPGAGLGATEADASRVAVRLDDVALGELVAPPDDGLGEWVELRIDDAAILARLTERRDRSLRLSVSDGHGLCLYARDERGAPAGIELRFIQ
jgi:mannan endo-1,4-beta-mannosidase